MGLAGRREKQRISADPQNRGWADDEDKIGFKMMQAMGWTSGKGLGKNEDGMSEHIKVSLKANNLGIGADRKSTDNWMDNTFAFSSLLENLNKNQDQNAQMSGREDDNSVGAETKDDSLRASANQRLMHRRKFQRSKNVASFRSDELSRILGERPSSTALADTAETDQCTQTDQCKPNESTFETNISSMAIPDYFAARMPQAVAAVARGLLADTTRKMSRSSESDSDSEDTQAKTATAGLGIIVSKNSNGSNELRAAMGFAGFARFGGGGGLASAFVRASDTTENTDVKDALESSGTSKSKSKKETKLKKDKKTKADGSKQDKKEMKKKKKDKKRRHEEEIRSPGSEEDLDGAQKKRRKKEEVCEVVPENELVAASVQSGPQEQTVPLTKKNGKGDGNADKASKKSGSKKKRDKWGNIIKE
ncbi:PIN2/TERF1-interacting telomerase inhibitor 1 [Entophlyctis luteolus]|nr:PIN2/TERF1-interacting telomerase inhibitor 1 [Entophlyctis luteolus]